MKRTPDFEQFLKILWRKDKPNHLPFYEHIASPGFIARKTNTAFDKMTPLDKDYWKIYVDFWIDMGFDCVPLEIPLNMPLGDAHDALSEGSEALVMIRNREDYENYPWANETSPIDFSHFETVAKLLPNGAKIVGGVSAGPYEWTSWLLGTIGMSYMLMDDPELVRMVFERIGRLHHSADRQLATMDAIGALRQGDDLGFRTSTFLSPNLLRELVFPTYKKMVEAAHKNDKPFILHSCGQLAEVYDDLVDDCKIDAKHSFEDAITPVSEFKKQYGSKVTALGGLDVDMICRSTEEEVRAYAKTQIEKCFADGYWALGTGNSLTNYIPVENYMAVLDVGMEIAG